MSKETKCNLINCLTGHTCGRNIENAKETKCNNHCVLIAEPKLPKDKCPHIWGIEGEYYIIQNNSGHRCGSVAIKEFSNWVCPVCSPKKEEPKEWLGGGADEVIDRLKEEPKESFEERTAKKLDNDILDKIYDKAKQETLAKVREMIEEVRKKYLGNEDFLSEIGEGVSYILDDLSDKLKGI